jgi:hypothetical protein
VEADPRGGTLGGFFRATMRAVNSRPLIASLLRRDRRVIGSYLRKPDNLFAWVESGTVSVDFIQALQAAGAVRPELDPAVMAHILEMLGYGQMSIADFKPADHIPPYEAVMETLAEMMDRLADVIRDRIRLHRRARVLTAQTQLSKRVLIAIPFVVFVILYVVNREYLLPLYDSSVGRIMLLTAGALLVVGTWVMNKIAVLHY